MRPPANEQCGAVQRPTVGPDFSLAYMMNASRDAGSDWKSGLHCAAEWPHVP